MTVELTTQKSQAQTGTSASSLIIIKVLKEPPRDRGKQKNIRLSGNTTLDDTVNVT